MVVAITGSSGFLGKALENQFCKNHFEVVRLVHEENINSSIDNPRLIVYNDKLNNDHIVAKLTGFAPDLFIHCAWKGTVSKERNEPYQLSYNIPQTIDSIWLAHASGCKQWIGVGSQAEYGNKSHVISETDSPNPHTLYGKAKLSAGISALELCKKLKIKGIWNRIFSLYGPGDNHEYFIPYIINSFLHKSNPKVTSCEQLWDYLYIEDAAEAFYAQYLNQCMGLFNICYGTTISLKDVVHLIEQYFNDSPQIQFGSISYTKNQTMILSGNNKKIKKFTGWAPKTTIEKGLQQTIEYYRNLESI